MSRTGLRVVEFDDVDTVAPAPTPQPDPVTGEEPPRRKKKAKKKKAKKHTTIELGIVATTSGLGVSTAEEDIAPTSTFKGTLKRGMGTVLSTIFGDEEESYTTAYGGEKIERTIFFTPDTPGGKLVIMKEGSARRAAVEIGDSSDEDEAIITGNGLPPARPVRDDGGVDGPPPPPPRDGDGETPDYAMDMADIQNDMRRRSDKSGQKRKLQRADTKTRLQMELDIEEEKRVKRVPYFVMLVTVVNIGLLGLTLWVNGGIEPFEANPLLGPKTQVLVSYGAKYGPCIHDEKLGYDEPWRFITAMFLHVGILHLVFNMAFQVTTGRQLEKAYGTKRFAIIYIVSGVGGNLFSGIFVPDQVSCGASSSLYGLIGVMLIDLFQNWSKIVGPWKNLFMMVIQIIISLGIGMMPGIDNFAHVGGFAVGMLAGLVWLPNIAMGKWALRFKRLVMIIAFFGLLIALAVGFVIFYIAIPPESWCAWCENISCLQLLPWCLPGQAFSSIATFTC